MQAHMNHPEADDNLVVRAAFVIPLLPGFSPHPIPGTRCVSSYTEMSVQCFRRLATDLPRLSRVNGEQRSCLHKHPSTAAHQVQEYHIFPDWFEVLHPSNVSKLAVAITLK